MGERLLVILLVACAARADEPKSEPKTFEAALEGAEPIGDLTDRFAKSQVRLDAFLASGDSVLVKINSGQGSLGLLVNDPGMYRRTDSLVVQLRALLADIQANPKKYVSVRLF